MEGKHRNQFVGLYCLLLFGFASGGVRSEEEEYSLPALFDLGIAEEITAEPREPQSVPVRFSGSSNPPATGPLPEAGLSTPGGSGLSAGEPIQVRVTRFQFEGNTVFTDEELSEVVADFLSGELDNEGLEAARVAVTLHYVENGYINSGAVLPDQAVEDGTVVLKIVEGGLSGILLEGNRVLRDRFINSRVGGGGAGPLNMNQLQEPLLLLHRNTNVRRLNAEVKPGANPGESYLQIEVEENSPHRMGVDFANNRPPSVGEEQIEAWYTHTSLTGNGDTLDLRYGLLDRGFDDVMHDGFRDFSLGYILPLDRNDTTLHASFERNSYAIIEEPFDDLDIDGQSGVYRAGIRHPLIRKPNRELAVGAFFDHMDSETTLFGVPFSVNAGAVDGEIDTSVLRLTQEWTDRGEKHVLAFRATESIGLDIFDATDDGTERDGQFASFIGQGQYVRKIGETDTQFVLRGSVQLSNDPLLAVEQLSIGGIHSVRGYRENQLVRDMGYLGSAELHLPLVQGRRRGDVLTLVPFADIGGGWNDPVEGSFSPGREEETIGSVGVGVLIEPTDWIRAQVYWGYPLTDFDSTRDTLQDQGFHFRISVARF